MACNHRIVARLPVIERLGPRSTPISSASTISRGEWACAKAVLATRPAGRLFIRLDPSARIVPEAAAPAAGCPAAARSSRATWPITPVRSSASTSTNSPATSGSTLHATDRATATGERLASRDTPSTVATPAMPVGKPSGRSSADITISSTAVAAMPAEAALPPRVSGSRCTSYAQAPDRRRRSAQRRARKVTRMEPSEGSAKEANHCPSGGIVPP